MEKTVINPELLERLKAEAISTALVNGFKKDADVKNLIKKHRFDITRVPRPDSGVCWINGELVGSKGNVISITGAAKSRKTVLATSLISAALSGREILGVQCNLKEDEVLIHIDTEQGYEDYYNSVVRTIRIAGHETPPENFVSIHERVFDVAQRLDSLEALFVEHKPSVCVIDGIRDMLMDFNSNEETSKVISTIMRLSYDYDCLIICVIHVTKSHGNMRGALGTALEDKSETVIKVEKDAEDKDRSLVNPIYSRHKDFEPYFIRWNDELCHYETQEKDGLPKGRPKKEGAESIPFERHTQLLTAAFRGQNLRYGQAVEAISAQYSLGENKAKQYIKQLCEMGLIQYNEFSRTYSHSPI